MMLAALGEVGVGEVMVADESLEHLFVLVAALEAEAVVEA